MGCSAWYLKVFRSGVARWLPMTLLMVAGLLLSPAARAEGNANFLFGIRSLDDGLWSPVDNQAGVGVQVDWRPGNAPVRLAVGLSVGEANEFGPGPGFFAFLAPEITATSKIEELSVGVDKVWKPVDSILRPVVGGGVVFARARYTVGSAGINDRDSSPGVYVHGGLFWATSTTDGPPYWNWGFDIRLVGGTDLELSGAKGDADYAQLAFLTGIGW